MLPLRHATGWRVAGAVLLIAVLVSTLLPATWVLPSGRGLLDWLDHADKWGHALTFAFLAVWFSGQYRSRSFWRIGLGLLLFAFLTEGCQRLVAYRTADWFDIAADAVGIIVGLSIATAGLGGWSLRVEDWYSRRMAGPGID